MECSSNSEGYNGDKEQSWSNYSQYILHLIDKCLETSRYFAFIVVSVSMHRWLFDVSADACFINQETMKEKKHRRQMCGMVSDFQNVTGKITLQGCIVQTFGRSQRTCRKSVSEQGYSASCWDHMYHLMLCGNIWNMRQILKVNEHIQRALYLLSLP